MDHIRTLFFLLLHSVGHAGLWVLPQSCVKLLLGFICFLVFYSSCLPHSVSLSPLGRGTFFKDILVFHNPLHTSCYVLAYLYILWHVAFSFPGMSSCPPLRSAFCQFFQNGSQSPLIPVPPPPFAYQYCACHHTPPFHHARPFHLCAVLVCSSSTSSLSLLLVGSFLSLECSLPTAAPKYSAMTGSFLAEILPSQRHLP